MTSQRPPAPPRSVPGRAWGTLNFRLLVGGMLVGVTGWTGAAMFTLSGGPVWDDWILDDRGVATPATLDVSTEGSWKSNGRWVHVYQWRATDRGGAAISGVVHARDAVPSPASVEYDPERPSRSRLAGGRASWHGPWVFVPLGAGVLGSLLFAVAARSVARRKAIYREGVAAEAEVIAVAPTWLRDNGDRVYRVSLRFAAPGGEVTARCETTEALAPGARAWVIHDPAAPTRALLA